MANNLEKFRILFVHSSAELYGSDICLFELVTRLPNSYEKIVVLPEEGPLAKRLRDKGIPVIVTSLGVIRRQYIHPLRIFIFLFRSTYSIVRLIAIIEKERIDLVHTNVSVVVSASIAAFLTKRPHVWHIREIFPTSGVITKSLMRFIDKFSDKIICISMAVKEQLKFSEKAVVIYDGIDTKEIKKNVDRNKLREEFNINKSDFIIGTIGRINLIKGQKYLIKSMAEISKTRKDVKLFIVGDVYRNNVKFKLELVKAVNELGIRQYVFFTGFRDDIYDVLSSFNIFVLASSLPEGLGKVIIEAMMMGKPVVATMSGGPSEVVIDGETGFLVPPKDPEKMAEAISKLLNNEGLRKRFGRAGRKRVKKLFSIETKVEKIVNIYGQVLGGGK